MLHRPRHETPGQATAKAALADARAGRAEVARRGPEVTAVAGQLRELRERNHFAEMIDAALRGGGTP